MLTCLNFFFPDIVRMVDADWTDTLIYNFEFIDITNSFFFLFKFKIYFFKIYLEPSSTFFISPMMERTLFELSQAISAYRIVVVHAQWQYGRSAIIQTSAQLFYKNNFYQIVLVYNVIHR